MILDKLESGLLLFDTPQGLIAVEPSFRERLYLLWTFRNFRQLSLPLLNARQNALVKELAHKSSANDSAEYSPLRVIGVVENFGVVKNLGSAENVGLIENIAPAPAAKAAASASAAMSATMSTSMSASATTFSKASVANGLQQTSSSLQQKQTVAARITEIAAKVVSERPVEPTIVKTEPKIEETIEEKIAEKIAGPVEKTEWVEKIKIAESVIAKSVIAETTISETTIAEPAAKIELAVKSTIAEPIAKTEPVVKSKIAEPIAKTKIAQPIVRTKIADPIVKTKIADPIVKTKIAEPVVKTKIPEPITKTKIAEPKVARTTPAEWIHSFWQAAQSRLTEFRAAKLKSAANIQAATFKSAKPAGAAQLPKLKPASFKLAPSSLATTAAVIALCFGSLVAWHRIEGVPSSEAHSQPVVREARAVLASSTSTVEPVATDATSATAPGTLQTDAKVESEGQGTAAHQTLASLSSSTSSSAAPVAITTTDDRAESLPARKLARRSTTATSRMPLSTIDTGIQATRPPLHFVYPNYSDVNAKGVVALKADVDANGQVRNVKVVKGNRSLAAAAIRAVRQWRYRPYVKDGHPVATETNIVFSFFSNEAITMSFPPSIAVAR